MAAVLFRADGSSLSFDAVLRIVYTETVNVTDHAIEKGVPASDHAQIQPLLVSMTAVVSETPLASAGGLTGRDRTRAADTFLTAVKSELVSLVEDTRGTTANLQLTHKSDTVDAERRLEFSLEFKQITFAEVGFVEIPVSAPVASAATGMPDRVDKGAQPTTSTDQASTGGAAQAEADQSWLVSGLESIGVL